MHYAYDWLKYKSTIQSKVVTKPIGSYDFLREEAKGICAELITAEHKCMEVQCRFTEVNPAT